MNLDYCGSNIPENNRGAPRLGLAKSICLLNKDQVKSKHQFKKAKTAKKE